MAATLIISGDEDLRVLYPFRRIPILTPQSFMAQWEGEEQPDLPGNQGPGTTEEVEAEANPNKLPEIIEKKATCEES